MPVRLCVTVALLLTLAAHAAQVANLHINEFVTENLSRANDPTAPVDMDNEYPDWIEIKNNEAFAVSMAGYSLSNDPNLLTKWTFASNTIPAYGYLVIFASGKNRSINNVQPHTNFKLNSSGQLFLSRPDGVGGMIVVHSIAYDHQRQTVSYGLLNNSPTGAPVYFTVPTPGVANNTASAVTNFVGDTHFDVDRGIYAAPFTVNISCSTTGATIAYTLNGSIPSPVNGIQVPAANSLVAPTASVAVTRTTLVRARAWKTGIGSSDVDTQSYLFLSDVMTQNAPLASMNLSPADTLAWGTSGGNLANLSAFPGLTFFGVNQAIATDANAANRFSTNDLLRIPVVSLVMDWRHLFGTNTTGQTDGGIYPGLLVNGVPNEGVDRAASLELINPAGDPLNPNQEKGFQADGNVHIFGGTSQDRWKSYKLSLRFQCAQNVNYPMYGSDGAAKFDNFVLDARINNTWNHPDANGQGVRGDYVNDQVVADLQNAVSGRGGFHNRPVHLFLDGLYWGLYSLHEKPDHHFAEAYYGGDSDDWDAFKHSVSPSFSESDPLVSTRPSNPTNAISRSNATVIDNYEAMLDLVGVGYVAPNPAPDLTVLTNYEAVATKLDIDDFIDYMIVNFLAGNWDWSDKNLYATYYRAGNGKWRFHSWDSEHTFRTGSENFLTGSGNETPRLGQPKGIHNKLKLNAEYRLRFADHIRRLLFNNGPLTVAGMSNAFNIRLTEIDAAIRGESARWGHIRASGRSSPNANIPFKRSDWLARRNSLLVSETGSGPSLLQNRWNLLMAPSPAAGSFRTENLYPPTSAPDFSNYGGAVAAGFQLALSHNNAGGVIYFTTDGTDPRVYGTSAVAPTAQSYVGTLTLNKPTLVRARVLNGAQWSALTEAMFYMPQDLTALVVSEIMYNPPGTGLVSGDEFEFLELKNVGTNTLDLGGLAFTSGIDFAFTNGTRLSPGQFFLLVRNPVQFTTRYPGVPINGVYLGRLDNGGEQLRISHTVLGTTLLSFDYNDRSPWPVTADGYGYSAVLNNPAARPDLDVGRNWRASTVLGGSPGTDDPAPAISPVLINEVLTASMPPDLDAIELFNPNASDVNIGGWFLTDDANFPMKFRIPTNTIIAAGGYRVFTENDFNPTPGTNDNFSLSSLGEEVYLFSGDANTNLTGYSHGFNFGTSAPGVTFGRYVISTGEEQFPAQLVPTLGTNNAGPLISPVVISEIMYRPPDLGTNDNSQDEFIELANISTNAVPLFDPEAPTNTWRISGGVDFSFPTNVTLASGERLLVINFDPATNAPMLATFRQVYGFSTNLQIYGPYNGKLDNSGQNVELKRPVLVATGILDHAIVDKVSYRDHAPWPSGADGSGASLQRIHLVEYGNDPINWLAALPTAGNLLPAGQPPVFTVQPVSQTVLEDSTTTFTVAVAGTGPFTFLWYRDTRLIATNDNGALTLDHVRFDQQGDYSVTVLGASGVAVSSNATLTVLALPKILVQPQSTNVYITNNVTLTVTASSPNPLTYQWIFNGTDIPGATAASLTITNVQIANEGGYRVLVTDSVGTRGSDVAWLQPMKRLAVVQGLPSSLTTNAGVDLTFTAVYSGYPLPFTWQFKKLTPSLTILQTVVTNATNQSFVLSNVQFTNAALYQITVSNLASPGGVSTFCNLTILSKPLITGQPTNRVVNAGSNAVFAVTAVGTATLTYQWWFNETNLLAGATNVSLTVSNVLLGVNDGGYSVVVSNGYGTATSTVATLTVRQPAYIVQQPADTTVVAGSNATLSVVAGGGEPYSYRWYFTNLVVGTNASLVLSNVQPAHAGGYQVVVTNELGAATSRVAQLTIGTGDADGNGLPDAWEALYGLGPGTDRNADPDGDGQSNWEEYISGTNPTNAASVLKITLNSTGGNGATVSFTAMPDMAYSILYQTNLAGTWLRLTNIAAQAGTNVIQVNDPTANARPTIYYRIATPPVP